ncbi:hypothetical protein GCM10014715_52990 [Streptomyces spiralis]|uniref:Uncharacterized protein n=1 Tax=Streptomyces spiralis TaxID=66376 RepID=A0A919A722_9ACTN|nr:hypothetical protein GCM10014715_52990 [Streptomyces spiralis]
MRDRDGGPGDDGDGDSGRGEDPHRRAHAPTVRSACHGCPASRVFPSLHAFSPPHALSVRTHVLFARTPPPS